MKDQKKSMFVGLIGIGLITFNLILAVVILSPPLVTQELYAYNYQIVVYDYPDSCDEFQNGTSSFVPYYYYSNLTFSIRMCGLNTNEMYLIDFLNVRNRFAYGQQFSANNPDQINYYDFATLDLHLNFSHGDQLIISLYFDTNNSLIVRNFSQFVDLNIKM